MQWINSSMGVRKHRAKGGKGRKGAAVACAEINRMMAKPTHASQMFGSIRELMRSR